MSFLEIVLCIVLAVVGIYIVVRVTVFGAVKSFFEARNHYQSTKKKKGETL
jgi:hypothetical protein